MRAERFSRLFDFVVLKKDSAKSSHSPPPAVPFFLAHDNVTESKERGLGLCGRSLYW